ncbi:MAG: threonine/serine dehydratase [Marivibrio sp.]|uniref:threonine/serine dehydratase n=1 Tax=Marivibrio sp. TaxID=2039719 RepID=UPI0032EEB82D
MSAQHALPTPEDVADAHIRIADSVRRTPTILCEPSDLLSVADGPASVTLKLEQMQHTGSFKARGAFNALLAQPVTEAGVIAASGGNHGAAVAYAARSLGVRAEIFVPEISHPAKQARLRGYGAEVHVVGRDFAEALEACEARRAQTGARLLHAYDQPEILAGQGTCALEWVEQAPDLDTLLIAVGGGGLVGGCAAALAGAKRIVAVETQGTPALNRALAAGEPTTVEVSGLAADSLGARTVGALAFEAAARFGVESLLVGDEAVRDAQRWLWDRMRQAAEPGGATALAALLSGAYQPAPGERVGVLVCGANMDPTSLA